MTPEQLKDIRDRLSVLESAGWRYVAEPQDSWGGMGEVLDDDNRPVAFAHLMGFGAFNAEDGSFVAHSRQDIPALLSHVDALQARLDAAEAERDQLRAIFACDLLEDSEALRLAYERGKADRVREERAERAAREAGGFEVPSHIQQALQDFFDQGRVVTGPEIQVPITEASPTTFRPVTLEAKKLPLQVRVSDELLRDAGGTP